MNRRQKGSRTTGQGGLQGRSLGKNETRASGQEGRRASVSATMEEKQFLDQHLSPAMPSMGAGRGRQCACMHVCVLGQLLFF